MPTAVGSLESGKNAWGRDPRRPPGASGANPLRTTDVLWHKNRHGLATAHAAHTVERAETSRNLRPIREPLPRRMQWSKQKKRWSHCPKTWHRQPVFTARRRGILLSAAAQSYMLASSIRLSKSLSLDCESPTSMLFITSTNAAFVTNISSRVILEMTILCVLGPASASPSPPNRLVILNGLSAGAALIISRRLFSSETAEPLFSFIFFAEVVVAVDAAGLAAALAASLFLVRSTV
mmetsp:Transcript_40029/g.66655  ORF Transcript_40029/g.66655 Transcript_40029/m.66655 type:complete len:236 (-) Transcript_40029:794-1501(-)